MRLVLKHAKSEQKLKREGESEYEAHFISNVGPDVVPLNDGFVTIGDADAG